MADTMTQRQMLDRVRVALGRSPADEAAVQPAPARPDIPDHLVRLAWPHEDLIARFTAGATFVGMEVRPVKSDEAPRAVLAALAEVSAQRITVTLNRLGEFGGRITEAITAAGITLIDWHRAGSLEPHFEADAGVTDVHAALAETGSLICASGPAHSRGTSLAVPFHLAVVRSSDILPDLFDYLDALPEQNPVLLPSSTAVITGPSKTADIEGVLITGVHGPGRVVILLVEDA